MHHPPWPSTLGTSRRDRARRSLQRIADTLGYPVEAFLRTAQEDAYLDAEAELVRLWLTIHDPAVRQTVLEQVRTAANEPG